MKLCDKCGANIEGLVKHCDCCGAPIVMHVDFISWHTFVMQASGDLPFFTNQIFHRIISSNKPAFDKLSKIDFELYCYPEEIVRSNRLKTDVYYSEARGKLRVRVTIDYNSYVSETTCFRKTMVIEAITQGICLIKKRLEKSDKSIHKYIFELESRIHQIDPAQL